ncbi:3-keto-5-aminohexanoate cleavage protein [Amaricoccus sp.]|uniref:3-keto-5-aminohexanoate cleavage protein n=1 Tax=Amaricoccus sp. TaxID=1872485 RepID=UPI001B4FB959|nr:3-keto-5-aminohexanoate cleavage protein [Amaricoccus sp.]MBP7002737.1 3-keto-5-aminohexanoate cleavage protein [Amaricoccus sp.]
MTPLARIMVAPNGARKTKADHPALPVTIPEIVACASACHAAGADGLHAHVRDAEGGHVLDAGLYAELLVELARVVPAMQVQVTTEAVGRYTPAEQRRLVETLRPPAVSIALREITAEPDMRVTTRFFRFCAEAGIAVQHILYDPDEVDRLASLVRDGVVPADGLQLIHVLGRYTPGQVSSPADLAAPVARLAATGLSADWAVCAFGPAETAILVEACRLGGKARIGFENNLLNANGVVATDNAERVAELADRVGGRDPS